MTILSFCEFNGTRTTDRRAKQKKRYYSNIYIQLSSEACGSPHRFIHRFIPLGIDRKAAGLSHVDVGETEAELKQVNIRNGMRLRFIQPSPSATKPSHHLPSKMCSALARSHGACIFLRKAKILPLGTFFQNLGPKDPLEVMWFLSF